MQGFTLWFAAGILLASSLTASAALAQSTQDRSLTQLENDFDSQLDTGDKAMGAADAATARNDTPAACTALTDARDNYNAALATLVAIVPALQADTRMTATERGDELDASHSLQIDLEQTVKGIKDRLAQSCA